MKYYFLFIVMVLAAAACKDKDKVGAGIEEGRKIESTLIGHKYKVAGITDQNSADARAKFAACMLDDIYFIKDRGTLEITQGAAKCGKETLDKKNVSWAVAYGENEVSAMQFPFFNPGDDYYNTREFLKPLFSVDLNTGAISLIIKVGGDTYTIRLEQTL
jgi:hypothetical protein